MSGPTGLHPAQVASVRDAQARLNLWEGAVRSGKTVGSIVRWLRYLTVDGPPGAKLMVGRTERTLERNVLTPIIDMVGARHCRIIRGTGEAVILGQRVWLVGANDERAADRIQGSTLAGAYVDEASLIPATFWQMLLSRLSIEGARLFATANPDGPRHWLKVDYLDRPELDLARFRFRLDDNPSLSPEYVAALKAEYVGLWYRRFVLGLWVAAEGAVYDQLNIEPGGGTVVRRDPDPRTVVRWWVAVDYGTANPLHALLLARDTAGRTWVVREWRWDSRQQQRQLTDSEYRTRLVTWVAGLQATKLKAKPAAWVVDPSAASFLTELRTHSLPAHPADNAVLDGIRRTAGMLATRHLVIHQSCRMLLDELAGYVWDPKAQARGVDQPVKVDDHGPDALRYAVHTLAGDPAMGGVAW